jgi:hypothetical protein
MSRKAKNKIRSILIDIHEDMIDISFGFEESGELFSASEFKGKTGKALDQLHNMLGEAIIQNPFLRKQWGKEP